MKHTKIIAMGAIASLALAATPLFAETAITASASVAASASTSSSDKGAKLNNLQATLAAKIRTKADQEIDRRTAALNSLATRVGAMKRVSDGDKASLTASIQGQLSTMADLKAKIDADATPGDLRTDVKSITSSYRIFMLVIPQGRIEAAGDRALDVAGLMTDLSAKLQTRITAAGSGGTDVTALATALADMNAKVADAKVQAQAAIDATAGLKPDNGNDTVMNSNTQALKDAKAKIEAALADLKAARQDVTTILNGLKAKTSVKASASASANAQ